MPKLRDYLAVNAPEVPDWFRVFSIEYPKFNIQPPEHPKSFSNDETKKLYFDWLDDPCWDLDHAELLTKAKEWEQYWKQQTIYKNQRTMQLHAHKIVSWQYFYADQMIAARKNGNPKPLWLKHPLFALLFMLFLAICYLITSHLENSNAIL